MRNYIHERGVVQSQKSDTLNRIHRLLTLMNIKVQHLISDIEGVGGMKLLRAIASGISDPRELFPLMDLKRFKASPGPAGVSSGNLQGTVRGTIADEIERI